MAEQLTGWTQAEAIGRPVNEIFHIISEKTRQPSIVPVKATLANGMAQGLINHTVLIAAMAASMLSTIVARQFTTMMVKW